MKTLFRQLGAVILGLSLFPAISEAQNDSLLDAATIDRLNRNSSGGAPPDLMTGYSSGYDRGSSRGQVDLQTYERRNQAEATDRARGIKEAMRKVAETMPKKYGEKREERSTGITDGNWQANRLARIRGERPADYGGYQTYDYRQKEERRERRGILETIGDKLGSTDHEDRYIERRRAGLVEDEFDPVGRLGDATSGVRSMAGNLAGVVLPGGGGGGGEREEERTPANYNYRPEPLQQAPNRVAIPPMIAEQAQPTGAPRRQPEPAAQDEVDVQPMDEESRTASYLGAGSESATDPRVRKLTDVFGKRESKPAPAPTASTEPATESGSIFTKTPMRGYTPPNRVFQPASTEVEAAAPAEQGLRSFEATPPPPSPVASEVENPYLEENPAESTAAADPAPEMEEETVGAPRKSAFTLPKIRIGGGDKVNNGEPEPEPEKPAAAEGPGFGSRLANSVRGLGASAPSSSEAANTAILASGGSGNYYAVKPRSSEFHGYNDYSVSASNVVTLQMGAVVELTKAGEEWSAVRLPDGREGIMRTKDLRKARAGEVRSGSSLATPSAPASSSRPAVAPAPAPASPPAYDLGPLPTRQDPPAATTNANTNTTSGGGTLTRDGARIRGTYYAAPEETPLPEIEGESPNVELGQGILAPAPPPRNPQVERQPDGD